MLDLQDMAPLDQPPLVTAIFRFLPGLRVNLIAYYSTLILMVLSCSLAAGQKGIAACVEALPVKGQYTPS